MLGDPCVVQLPLPCNESAPTGRLNKTMQEELPICNDYDVTMQTIWLGFVFVRNVWLHW